MKSLLAIALLLAAPAPPVGFDHLATADLLAQAKAAMRRADFRQVAAMAAALLERTDPTLAHRVEALWLQGEAIAVVSDPVDAEAAFRELLRLSLSYEPPAEAEPRAVATFRKVQVDEKRLAERTATAERARMIATLSLTGPLPDGGRGGRPVPFVFHLKDPHGAVDKLGVLYRLGSSGAYSTLALERGSDGRWSGAIPGELTANDQGARLEYVVEASDPTGALVQRGTRAQPLVAELLPGQVPGRKLPRWPFTVSLATSAVVGVGAASFGIARGVVDEQLRQAAANAIHSANGLSSDEWASRVRTGQLLGDAAWVMLASTAVLVGVTLLLGVFTDF